MTIQMIDTQLLTMTPDEARRCVREIHSGLSSLREKIYDLWIREGWKSLGYLSWTECVENEFPESSRRVWQEFSAAKTEINLLNLGSVGTIPERQLRPLTSLEPETQKEVWRIANDTAPEGKITARHVQSVVDEIKGNGKPHVTNNSGNNEWYTPPEYIKAARQVLGEIDLDPASSDLANGIVEAKKYYTIDDNGLSHDWSGRVWMNPPYSSDSIGEFCKKYAMHVLAGDISGGIVLVNNATETGWFNLLIAVSRAVVFPRGRILYLDEFGEKKNAPLQGQAFIYTGDNPDLFIDCFKQFGWGAKL